MIRLFTFGPQFGLPDASPFGTKAHMLLKFAGLDYKPDLSGFKKAPKGKQPYIEDEGEIIPDSTFIRMHIEKKYGFDFDKGLDARSKGAAWAAEKLCEDHLYWVVINDRWTDKENFARGPRMFFDEFPAPLRPIVRKIVRGQIVKSSKAHGMGRHSVAEVHSLAARGLDALSGMLGDNLYFSGDRVTGADATVFAFIDSLSCPIFDTPVVKMVEDRMNLKDYRNRMRAEFFPELAQ